MGIQFLPKRNAELFAANLENVVAVDVSSYGKCPFDRLSPFTYSRYFQIPVPGMKNRYSHSVEGIWQGLKVIDGITDESLFEIKPLKRKGVVSGHMFGNESLNIEQARIHIFFPAYYFYLDNYAPKEAIDFLLNAEREGKKVIVYDVNDTADIRSMRPLSHASVLATYLNFKILASDIHPHSQEEKELMTILNGKDNKEKIRKLLKLHNSPELRRALTYICLEHPKTRDDYSIGRFCQKEGIIN